MTSLRTHVTCTKPSRLPRLSGFLLAPLLLAACAAGRTPPPVELDPSNPEAPASAATQASAPLAAEPQATEAPAEQTADAGHDPAQHAASGSAVPTPDAGSVIYACPMHPEVTDTKPSRCPKCGMTLVARKPPAAAAPTATPPKAGAAAAKPDAGVTVYACPMHPEVTDTKPSRCPKCGMKLVPQQAPATPTPGHEGHEGHGTGGGTP